MTVYSNYDLPIFYPHPSKLLLDKPTQLTSRVQQVVKKCLQLIKALYHIITYMRDVVVESFMHIKYTVEQKKKEKVTHRDLLELMKTMGYPKLEGICFGLSRAAMRAGLAGDIRTFNQRLDKLTSLLYQHQRDYDKVVATINKDPAYALEIRAFFDGIVLMQNSQQQQPFNTILPGQLPEEFPKNLLGSPESYLLPSFAHSIVESKALHKKGGMESCVHNYFGVYNLWELTAFLKELREIATKIKAPIAIHCGYHKYDDKGIKEAHAVALIYDLKKKEWMLFDANQLPVQTSTSDVDMAMRIRNTEFRSPLTQTFPISSQIFTHSHKKEPFIEAFKNNNTIASLHKMTPDKLSYLRNHWGIFVNYMLLQMKKDKDFGMSLCRALVAVTPDFVSSDEGKRLFDISIAQGHQNLMRELIQGGADVNREEEGTSRLLYAVCRNQPESVKMLIESGAHIKGLIGFALTSVADTCGYKQILRILKEATKSST